MYLKIISFFVFFIISSCSAQTSSNLYQSLEKDYPESKYLSAVGEGDTRKDAEKNAMGKLALIFESKIDMSQTLNEHYSEFSDAEGSSLTYESTTKKRTNVSSNQKLLNVKYGKHSVDEVGNNYIVAYINRRETAAIYDEKIENLNSSILSLEANADNANSKIKKYAALNRASKLMNENLSLMQQQTIISPYNPDFSDKVAAYNSIYRKKGEAANSITFVVSDSSEDIKNSLSSIITSKGFKIAANGDFLISSSLKYEEVDLGRKEIFYNWFMNIELTDSNNEIIFNFDKSGREGGMSESAVYSRAKYSANKALTKEFIIGFEKYLDSLLGMDFRNGG
ncbi:MAG: hypothetical protein L3J41_14305 [Melioribacteraceae bacterium]|nr:hypothetical protein [Melioribacteraceae bacterium]